MPKTYTCKDCKKVFDQKSHYDAHKDKKIPCICKDKPLKQVIEETVAKEVDKKIKTIKKKVLKDEIEPEIEEEIKQTNKLKKGKKNVDNIDYSYLRLPSNEVIFELKENDGLILFANLIVAGEKNNVLASPFFVKGMIIFPLEISRSFQLLSSNSLLRAPESASIQTNKVNNLSFPILAANVSDMKSCSLDATYRTFSS